MNEDINILENTIQDFFDSKNNNHKNEKFKSFYYNDEENINNIRVIYDNKNYIYYLLNIPKSKENIINGKNEYEIIITDSSYDLFFSKRQNTINCLLIIIINDIDVKITNENYFEFKEEKLININFQEKIINKIKGTITDYIKAKSLNGNNDIQNILLRGKDYNFLYNKYLNENINDNIKTQIEYLSKLCSKVEVRILSNNNFEINNLFMNAYEILSPSYKSALEQKYLNEMPMNIYNLIQKYKFVNINKNSYDNYKNKKISLKNKKPNVKNKIEIVDFNINKEKINGKKIKNIFKLKKFKRAKRAFKIINKKINIKRNTKKSLFKIHKIKLENKEENQIKEKEKKEDNINNKMTKEVEKKIIKKKNIFQCMPIPKVKTNNIFIVKK